MASEIYSRYIPARRKSKEVPVTNLAPELPSTASLSHRPTSAEQQPSTQKDASATYARYIPPSKILKPQSAISEEAATANITVLSKRKRDINDGDLDREGHFKQGQIENPNSLPRSTLKAYQSVNGAGVETGDQAAKNKKRMKKSSRSEVDKAGNRREAAGLDPPIDDETIRHKSLFSKREKSLKKAGKLSRKAAKEAEQAGESVGDEGLLMEEALELHALEPLPQPERVPEPIGKSNFSGLPDWLASPRRVSPEAISTFAELGLEKKVSEVLQSKGFEHAFAVQAAVLQILLPGDRHEPGDVLISAATGSGKTLAYVLPMIADISQSTVTRLQGLIVMPTRELVNQVREVCEVCSTAFAASSRKRVRIGTAIGNQPLKTEQASLMTEEQRYDPEEYRRREQLANAKWESSSYETEDGDFNLSKEDMISPLPNHIVQFTSKVDVLICTPGRLVEHLKLTPGFTLDFIKWLIIDEADKLLDQSFQQWLEAVMARLPYCSKLKLFQEHSRGVSSLTKVVLSATVTRDLGQLSSLNLNRPKLIVLEGVGSLSTRNIDIQSAAVYNLPRSLHEAEVKVDSESEKPLYLLELLKIRKMFHSIVDVSEPDSSGNDLTSSLKGGISEDESDVDDSVSLSSSNSALSEKHKQQLPVSVTSNPRGVLIFTRSNESAARLSRLLQLLEPSIGNIIGTLTSTTRSSLRKKTLQKFRLRDLSILIASDLVARGLDILNLAHVVNYDVPTSLTSYIHRVGRTARADREGYAWTLVSMSESRWFWNEIARSGLVRRPAGREMERVTIDASSFEGEILQRYEEALTTLGQEATEPRFAGLKKKHEKVIVKHHDARELPQKIFTAL